MLRAQITTTCGASTMRLTTTCRTSIAQATKIQAGNFTPPLIQQPSCPRAVAGRFSVYYALNPYAFIEVVSREARPYLAKATFAIKWPGPAGAEPGGPHQRERASFSFRGARD